MFFGRNLMYLLLLGTPAYVVIRRGCGCVVGVHTSPCLCCPIPKRPFMFTLFAVANATSQVKATTVMKGTVTNDTSTLGSCILEFKGIYSGLLGYIRE